MLTYENYIESTEALRNRIGGRSPHTLLILGSGLGYLADEIEDAAVIPYGELPHFPVSTAPDHKGRFVCGRLGGAEVLAMQGRFHLYEGYSAQQAAYPVRVARLLGVSSLLVTNACGGVNRAFHVGDLMLITDHLKLFDPTPLSGPNDERFGPRFPDMTYAYDPAYQEVARRKAQALSVTLREGIYCFFPGPQFETPAEVRAARLLGASAVGMSTVPEVIAANHCGIRVLGFSLVTNMAAGVLPQRLSGTDVTAAAEKAKHGFGTLVRACLADMKE
ncbi:MAG: purine-nucleoside phosphorylase [Clostridiaceae bacterium]|nr:purine-nucleoside phosphorylase [Clostridiaceae bacterium]